MARQKTKEMKKFLPLIIVFLASAAGVYFYVNSSYSASTLPYPKPENCQQNWLNQMSVMRTDWINYLETLLAQPKPTSDLVDDAFDSLRTYQCWLGYLCHTVRLSATMKPEEMTNWENVAGMPVIPGCAPAEEIGIPGAQLGYVDKCPSDKQGADNYQECMKDYARNFAPNDGSASKDQVVAASDAFLILEQRLKKALSDKKSAIMGKKLQEIINGMNSLESNVMTMGNLLQKLSSRIKCYPLKCD